MTQFRAVYQLGEKSIRKMLYSGELMGMRTPAGWRIVDPGPALLELMQQEAQKLATVPFIRGNEASELLEISDRRLRQLAESGEIEYKLSGVRRVYALQSLIELMSRRSERGRAQEGGCSRPWVKRWAREAIAKQLQQ